MTTRFGRGGPMVISRIGLLRMTINQVDQHTLMSGQEAAAAMSKMASRIRASNPGGTDVALVGIQRGGVELAQRLAKELEEEWGRPVPVGALDVALHRDDLSQKLAPPVHPTAIPFDVSEKNVILVDDVLFSGRTARAALTALHDLGRPKRVELAVLVDRGHRELPIKADIVGRSIPTSPGDRVNVRLEATDGEIKVVLEKGDSA